MAVIVNIWPESTGRYFQSGSYPGSRRVLWHVETDEQMDGGDVIRLAQFAGLPRHGDHLDYTSPSGYRFQDFDSYALEFEAEPKFGPGEDNHTIWQITVGYRAPFVGADEFPANIHLPPLSRPPEYWIEYGHGQRLQLDGYLVNDASDGSIASQRTAITNAAGQIVDDVMTNYRTLIWVAAYNTPLIADAALLTEHYENTTNSNAITVVGLPVAKHYARFVSAETSRIWEMGHRYPRIQVRIEVSKHPFYDEFPNIGDYGLEESASKARVQKDDAGRVVPNPVRLKSDGSADSLLPALQSTAVADRIRQYCTLEPINYQIGNGQLGLRF